MGLLWFRDVRAVIRQEQGAARNEHGGKIESDGIPQTCKDLLCVKPEPKRIICRGYEEALKHTSPDTHVLFLDPPYPETNSGYYKEDTWTLEGIRGIVDGLLKDGYQMVVTLNMPLKGLEIVHSVTKTSTKNSYGPIKKFDDLVMTNVRRSISGAEVAISVTNVSFILET